MEIADVIAHAMHVRLLFSLPPAGGRAGSHPGGSPGGSGGPGGGEGPRGTSGSSKKVNLGGDGELVASPPSFPGVISWGWRPESPEHNHCPLTRIKRGAEKV